MTDRAGVARRLREWLPLLAPLAAGALLRFWNLGGQIVGGDELHALRCAVSRPLSEILFRYEAPDLYMPLAVALHGLAAAGVTLGEHWLRLPGMAAGLLSLLVLPRLAARFVGPRMALLFAWLLALSPALVLYSRIARSYLPLILLGTSAALAFYSWMAEGRRRDLLLYLGGALGAVVFHPVAGPAVVAPLAFGLLDLPSHPPGERRARFRRWLPAALGLGLGLCAWFWRSRHSLLALLANRREPLSFDLESFTGLAKLQAGATGAVPAVLFWAAALGGLGLLVRRQHRFGLYLGILYLAPIVGLVALSPVAGDQPLLFNRYTLLALPLLLLGVAATLEWLVETARPRLGRAAFLPVAVVLALWLAVGPLVRYPFRAGSFAHHNDFVDFGCPPAQLPAARLLEVYAQMAREPDAGELIEAPWQPAWRFTRSLHAYQQHHRRGVRVVSQDPMLGDSRVRLSRLLPADEERWLASGARYLVVHLDLAGEEERLAIPACARRAGVVPPALAARLAEQGSALAARLHERWGAPRWASQGIAVWDLQQVRPASPRPATAGPKRH